MTVGISKSFSSSTTAAWTPPPPITVSTRGRRGGYSNNNSNLLRNHYIGDYDATRRLPSIHRGMTALRSTTTTASDNSKQPRKNATIMPPLTSNIMVNEDHLQLAHEAMQFIDNSPDPFHVVQSAKEALESAGFVEWKDIINNHDNDDDDDDDNGILQPGGKYYFTRNKSTLVAFAIGHQYQPSNGFKIIGSHTDSPNLKVKPYSKRTSSKDGGVSGTRQLSVECYGGGLWHTWFDRDLGVSGRVFVREEEEDGGDEEKIDNDDKDNDNVATKSTRIRQVRQSVLFIAPQ